MATKQLLVALTQAYTAQTGHDMRIESVGGVDAAKRVAACRANSASGEAFDIVLLASDAIDKLIAAAHVEAGSRVDWVRSPVAVAVQTGQTVPDISSEAALKAAVLDAPTLSYSTGPSGNYLTALFERWGITDLVKPKIIQPPPGVPVGSLIASGQVALGFQQLSEMLGVAGITVVGNLPADVAYITTFSSGIPVNLDTTRSQAIKGFQAFLASVDAEKTKLAHGMYWL